ncbi:MAG: MFS transporter [Candidatus Thorarchaeota archaeon]
MDEVPPRDSLGPEEPEAQEEKEHRSIRESLRIIFSWRNYSVYLITAWVYNGFAVIYEFFYLYLRALFWDFVLIGTVMAIMYAMTAVTRFAGGYLGDIVDRKKLSVLAIFMLAVYHLMMGIYTDFIFIFGALSIFSSMDLAKGGSTAYIMENIPKEHSGLALSLFQTGRTWGILVIAAFGLILPVLGFPESIRFVYLISGILLLVCTIARAVLLSPSPQKGRAKDRPLWRDFVSENKQAMRLILSYMPAVLAIVVLDGISDSLWKYGALIYTNETLLFTISNIVIMVFIPLVVSLPLLLKVGRLSDVKGMKRTTLLVYSIMPVCVGLLIIAQDFPLWVPESIALAADSLVAGLGLVFTTPFLAIVTKTINDSLWALVLMTLIQKSMPRTDTAKVLGIFWTTVYITSAPGPFIAGLIFQFLGPTSMFVMILIANLLILGGIARYGFRQKEPETLSERILVLESRIQELKHEIEDFRTRRGF